MMKKTLLFLMSVFAATAMSATDYVLDLSKPAYPEVINFTANGNAQVWSDTYNENEYILEFSPYMFSHLASGSSWNGTYWDGFTIVKCGDNATQTNWIANQWETWLVAVSTPLARLMPLCLTCLLTAPILCQTSAQ